ncbi:MAG: leucine-rich repeat protein [Ruminococcus sp.]|uniref:leucine-rich repeat protein n=1 Tax=Ruminococcus sp. TaxID=41978 RepID=UPI0025DDD58D|nr:leucine-rich repeat protein [Ruminococcus sp.]MCR5599496.1 leucine-rich repeat protein [Ruminococcus sp.]
MKRLLLTAAAAVLIFSAVPPTYSYAENNPDSLQLVCKVENKQVCITECRSSNIAKLVIPEKYEGLPVTAIGKNAFLGNTGITSCVIPDSVKSIDEWAFAACPNLSSVSIGSGVSMISDYAFTTCPKLTSFAVSKDNPDYTAVNSCLYNKSGDTLIAYAGDSNASVSDNTKTIGRAAFFGRENIVSVSLPDGLTAIGDTAFSGCLSLKTADIPDSVKKLGSGCFMSCTSLQSVKLGKSLTAIPKNSFHSCSSLTTVNFSDSVNAVENDAFFSCSALSGIFIPPTVKTIGSDAFGKRYDIRGDSTVNITDFIIIGEAGSAAEEYAGTQGITFTIPSFSRGDVNGDRHVDAVDASAVLKEYALRSAGKKSEFTDVQSAAADWNGDKKLDSVDASAILAAYVKQQTLYR